MAATVVLIVTTQVDLVNPGISTYRCIQFIGLLKRMVNLSRLHAQLGKPWAISQLLCAQGKQTDLIFTLE